MPSSGNIISFKQGVPIFADQAALFYRLSYSQFHGFNDNVIGAVKFYGATITALDEDVRLSKRLRMPAKRLRGFSSKQIA